MTPYDAADFRPPAPVASVLVRSPITGGAVANVSMLIDSGADVSCLPRDAIANLLDAGKSTPTYEIQSFDGTKSVAPVAQLEIVFLGKSFRGQFLLAEGAYGFLGRNILNNVSLLLDGPALTWSEKQ